MIQKESSNGNQDLILQEIFKVIRHENAVLWVGAGLSFSAGYPSGKTLRNLIFQDLKKEQKKVIDKSLPLPALAEEFERINESRDKLLQSIERIFNRVPQKFSEVHSQLGKIFHFDSIITTNYDTLIEDGYEFKCQVLRPKDPVSLVNSKKVQIFKVHGDFMDKRNLILTSSDYNKFFEHKREDEGLWTIIRSKFYTKHIIFIGYNLEDSNVSVLFDRIIRELDGHKKEAFLVAPNLESHKIRHLKKRGVTYCNSTGENFIGKLLDHLNRNVWKDFEAGICSLETFSKTARFRNIGFEIGQEKERLTIKSLRGLNDQVKTNLNMIFSKDGLIAEQLESLVSGKNIDPVTIDANLFDNLELKVGDLYWGTGNDFQELILKRTANHRTKADFVFEDNWEFNGVDLQFYGGQHYSNVKLSFKSADIRLQAAKSNKKEVAMDFSYKHADICQSVAEEINLYSFLKRISKGDKFDVFFDGNLHRGISLGKAELFYDHAYEALNQFQQIKKIEDYYRVKFRNIRTSELTNNTVKKITQIISFIDQIPEVIDDWSGKLTANIDFQNGRSMTTLVEEMNSKASIFWQENLPAKISLFNIELEVGYSYSIIEEPKISLLETNKQSCKISIESKNKILRRGFMHEKLEGDELNQKIES